MRGFHGVWGWSARSPERSSKRADLFYGLTRTGSEVLQQLLKGDIRLPQNRLERLGFDVLMHGHARMQRPSGIVAMGTRLANEVETQAHEGAAHVLS